MFPVWVCSVFLSVFIASVSSQIPLSPCPRVFTYVFGGTNYHGIITLSPPYGREINMTVEMDIPSRLPSSYVGSLELMGGKSEVIMDVINSRDLKYKVVFPIIDDIPLITDITVSGKTICRGKHLNGPLVTAVKLNHFLNANIDRPNRQNSPSTSDNRNTYVSNQYDSNVRNPQSNRRNHLQQNDINNIDSYYPTINGNDNMYFPNKEINKNSNNTVYSYGGVADHKTVYETNHTRSQFNTTNSHIGTNNRFGGFFQNTAHQSHTQHITTHKITTQQRFAGFGSQKYPILGVNDQPSIVQSQAATKPLRERPNPDTFALYGPEQTTIDPIYRRKLVADDLKELNRVCGISKVSGSKLNGPNDEVGPGTWPWLAAVYVKKINSLDFQCGGILISKDLVATASHCVDKFGNRPVRKEEIIVKLGVQNVQDWMDENTRTLSVIDKISHPDFDQDLAIHNDLVLLRIKRVNFTDYIIPACLASNDLRTENGMVVGWGFDDDGSIKHPVARAAYQKISTMDECKKNEPAFEYLSSGTSLCVKTMLGNSEASCYGDSGSGLLVNYNGRWWLRGLTSSLVKKDSLKGSCKVNDYKLFTDVSKYTNWFNSYIST